MLQRLRLSRCCCVGVPLALGFSLLAFEPLSGIAQSQVPVGVTPRPGQSLASVEPGTGGVTLVRPVTATTAADGFSQYRGVTSLDTPVRQLTLNRVVLPPGAIGPRNMHKNSETIVMVSQGTLTALVGVNGEKTLLVRSGEFLFVPGNVWHQWTNPGGDFVTIVEARADANPGNNLFIKPTR